jgi:capsular polysaccharide biosynthesis protein/Mrp family chromosome partitioning ATPase
MEYGIMEMKTYFDILLRHTKIVFFTLILLLVLVWALARQITPKYASSVSLRVTTPRSGGMTYVGYDIYYANRIMNTYVTMATSNLILNDIKANLNLQETPEVKAEVIPDTELIKITVSDTDPGRATNIANLIALKMVARSSEMANSANKAALDALNEQISKKGDQLEQTKGAYRALIPPNSQSTSRIANLTNQVTADQSLYLSLYNNYELSRKDGADVSITSSQAAQIFNLETQLKEERNDLEALNIKAAEESEQIRAALRDVTLVEQEYSNLKTQMDQVKALQVVQGGNKPLVVVDDAMPPSKPASPNYLLVYSIGTILSLFFAFLAGFIVDSIQKFLPVSHKIETMTRLPFLGVLRGNGVESNINEDSRENGIAYETQLNLRPIIQNKSIRSVVLTGIDPHINSFMHSLSLAKALADSGIKTILVDANLDTPSNNPLFIETANKVGLKEVKSGKISLDEAIIDGVYSNLSILPAGMNSHATETDGIKRVINHLFSKYEMVVIDISSIDSNKIPDDLLSCVDGIILLVELEKMKKKDFKTFIDNNKSLKPSIVGFLDFQKLSETPSSIPQQQPIGNLMPDKQATFQ